MALISSKYKQSVTGYGYNNNGYFMHFLHNKSDVLPLCPIISLTARRHVAQPPPYHKALVLYDLTEK